MYTYLGVFHQAEAKNNHKKGKGKSSQVFTDRKYCEICKIAHGGSVNEKCLRAGPLAVAKFLHQHNLSIDVLNADFERPHLVKSHMDLMAEAERPINDNQEMLIRWRLSTEI